MSELLNCPFCGGEVCIRRTPDYGSEKPRLFATCCVCGVETPRIARSRKEAVAAWNRRAQPDDLLTSTRRAQHMETVDTVEVFRCRDCVHFGECLVTENDYCSKGERKETY